MLVVSDIQAVSDIQVSLKIQLSSLVKSPSSIALLLTAEYIRSKFLQSRKGLHSAIIIRWQVFLVGKIIDFSHSFGLF